MEKFKGLKKIYKIIIVCALALLIIIISPIIWYNSSLKPVSKDYEEVKISIELGSSADSIADILVSSNLIKSKLAFKIYVKLNHVNDFQAGDYTLSKNMPLKDIVVSLQTGIVMKEQVSITFIEGKNMRWIAKRIANTTNNTEQDVFDLLKDTSYIDSLITEYSFITKEIKNKDIYYSLEGYLFPDTYSFDGRDVSVKEIFKVMLDEMKKVLAEYDLKNSKYSIHELLTIASIIELEGTDNDSRKDIASVLYNRLNSGMSLGSDVTTYYAYKIDMGERDLKSSELYSYNPYNTRGPEMFGKLPVGPICSPSKSSIEAAIYPNKKNYYYFVADKNGKVYFSKNSSEHDAIIYKLKNNGLWYEY